MAELTELQRFAVMLMAAFTFVALWTVEREIVGRWYMRRGLYMPANKYGFGGFGKLPSIIGFVLPTMVGIATLFFFYYMHDGR